MSETALVAEELLATADRFEAALVIFSAQDKVKQCLVERLIAGVEEGLGKIRHPDVTLSVVDRSLAIESWGQIAVEFHAGARFWVALKFDGDHYKRMIYGIHDSQNAPLKVGDCEADKRIATAAAMLSGKTRISHGWPWHSWPHLHDPYFPFSRDADPRFWRAIYDGKLAEHFVDFVQAVLEVDELRELLVSESVVKQTGV